MPVLADDHELAQPDSRLFTSPRPPIPVLADQTESSAHVLGDGSAISRVLGIAPAQIKPSRFSQSVYGDATVASDDLLESVREHGILVPLVVAPGPEAGTWQLVSGHRRLGCAVALGLPTVPCQVCRFFNEPSEHVAILEYNRYRQKNFSQIMREADAFEDIWKKQARYRRLANLRRGEFQHSESSDACERRNSDARSSDVLNSGAAGISVDSSQGSEEEGYSTSRDRGRTDERIARRLGIGGKDLYRQARAVWRLAQAGDVRARSSVAQLDHGTKTIHAAYKDLRRRDRFSADFRPTPYDVWSFRHDRAFGIPHVGSIPAAIVAHVLYYFTLPDALVVDPMAGGGTTLDVCQGMGRRCLAYDIQPVRPEITAHDVRLGFPAEAAGCDLIFCDPPYHTMLARQYSANGIARAPFSLWTQFLSDLARHAYDILQAGGCLALLLGAQTEKDLPAGFGYIDHAFLGYAASLRAGFQPEGRISCPMEGAYTPQQVRRARQDRRLLGQVRDLLILRKPAQVRETNSQVILYMEGLTDCVSANGNGELPTQSEEEKAYYSGL